MSGDRQYQNKILTLHYLRGIAALIVMYFHYVNANFFVSFDNINSFEGNNLFFPIIPFNKLPQLEVYSFMQDFNLGGFGVAIFFLITGFVIPMSLKHHTPISFIRNRFFRLYPLYAITLSLLTVLLLISGYLIYGRPDTIITRRFFENITMCGDPINPVCWSLVIEVQYVMLTFMVISIWRKYTWLNTSFIAVLLLALIYILIRKFSGSPHEYLRYSLSYSALDIIFILGGTFVYFFYSRIIQMRYIPLALLGFFLLVMRCSKWLLFHPMPGLNLLDCKFLAFTTFIVFILANYLWKRPVKFLVWLGDISYPLYLIHYIIGLVIMGWVVRLSGNVHIALWMTVIISMLLATLAHKYVELPFNSFGKLPKNPLVGQFES